MTTQLSTRELQPASLFTPTHQAAKRMLEFFTAQLNNPHTRRAYLNAARRFAAWCQDHQIRQLSEVQPVHVAAFIQDLQGQLAPATVKQHLAALRVLFDWLVTGHILQLNPAHAVRGPKWLTIPERGLSPAWRSSGRSAPPSRSQRRRLRFRPGPAPRFVPAPGPNSVLRRHRPGCPAAILPTSPAGAAERC